MLHGHQTWVFPNRPTILSAAAVGGPFEAKGPLAEDFDILHGDIWLGQDSYEKAERKMLEEACETAIKVSGFDRLRLKPIKEEVHNKIKESNRDYNVHVTSDKKLFMQLQQIENQVNGPQEKPLTDIQKKVMKINKDIQG
ncbi:MAG: Stage V sporulation protein AD [Pelotomaculum sp. PtaB.Bin013]|nr:MAG: Stage V sporulation protein AD [Pelotomaculum sp. PtaB.Bin013]